MGSLNSFKDLGTYQVLDHPADAIQIRDYFMGLDYVAFDTETTGLNNMKEHILVFSVSDGTRRWSIPVSNLEIFQPVFENPNTIKICHNIKFDAHMLKNHGVILQGEWHDTLVMSWLLNENEELGLKPQFEKYFETPVPTFTSTFGKKKKIKGSRKSETLPQAFERVLREEPNLAHNYASQDALMHFWLWDNHRKLLEKLFLWEGFPLSGWEYFLKYEVPFTKVLWRMEMAGFKIDLVNLKKSEPILEEKMDNISKKFAHLAGREVNLSSPKQISEMLYNQLGYKYKIQGKSSTTTDVTALKYFKTKFECPYSSLVLDYRDAKKMYSTYVKALVKFAYLDERIHTTLKQHGTVTGRLSSSDPNLQNIPRPDNDISNIRGSFVASPGYRLIVGDYAQLEMRLMAHFSQDQAMIAAILGGQDLHTFTAAKMFGYEYSQLISLIKEAKEASQKEVSSKEQRHLLTLRHTAKTINFGILYGMGAYRLMITLAEGGVVKSREECKALLSQYFRAFPGVHSYINFVHKDAKAKGYINTISGRRRRLPDANSPRRGDAARALRQSVNAIIQGSAADVVKFAMIDCAKDTQLKYWNVTLLLQVHDELIFEVPDNDYIVNLALEQVKSLMESPFDQPLAVPLPVDIADGYSWSEAK